MEGLSDYLKAALLGVLQGLTEFLPVSSSGHLAVLQRILNIQGPVLFLDVMLHVGTLIAIFVVFSKDIRVVLISMFTKGDERFPGAARLGWLAILGTVPIGVLGILFNQWIEKVFNNIPLIGGMFIVTGILLFVVRNKQGERSEKDLSVWDAAWVGLCQAIALLPGLSRSGMTIGSGLLLGIEHGLVVRFSFLMAIPAILGALILKTSEIPTQTEGIGIGPVILGTCIAAVVGYFGLKGLIRLTTSGKLHLFSFYLWTLGFVVLWASLM